MALHDPHERAYWEARWKGIARPRLPTEPFDDFVSQLHICPQREIKFSDFIEPVEVSITAVPLQVKRYGGQHGMRFITCPNDAIDILHDHNTNIPPLAWVAGKSFYLRLKSEYQIRPVFTAADFEEVEIHGYRTREKFLQIPIFPNYKVE